MLTDFNLGYCAALLEGEGSFCVRRSNSKSSYVYIISCQMTDLEPLQLLEKVLGGWINGPYKPNIFSSSVKPFWHWRVYKRVDTLRICKLLYPYMSPRRKQQIELIIKTMLEHPSIIRIPCSTHGTATMYSNKNSKCRCDLCCKAWRQYMHEKYIARKVD